MFNAAAEYVEELKASAATFYETLELDNKPRFTQASDSEPSYDTWEASLEHFAESVLPDTIPVKIWGFIPDDLKLSLANELKDRTFDPHASWGYVEAVLEGAVVYRENFKAIYLIATYIHQGGGPLNWLSEAEVLVKRLGEIGYTLTRADQ